MNIAARALGMIAISLIIIGFYYVSVAIDVGFVALFGPSEIGSSILFGVCGIIAFIILRFVVLQPAPKNGSVAQLAEQDPLKIEVESSILSGPTTSKEDE